MPELIEIHMRDKCGGLGAGMHMVEVISMGPRWLRCRDMTGVRHRVPVHMFKVRGEGQ